MIEDAADLEALDATIVISCQLPLRLMHLATMLPRPAFTRRGPMAGLIPTAGEARVRLQLAALLVGAGWIALLGWGILAVPTGIVTAEMTSRRLSAVDPLVRWHPQRR